MEKNDMIIIRMDSSDILEKDILEKLTKQWLATLRDVATIWRKGKESISAPLAAYINYFVVPGLI